MIAALKQDQKFVAYYRLSKPKKGMTKEETERMAYGLSDQREMFARFCQANVGSKVIAELTEIETGTSKKRRPKLLEALSIARLHKATLVIAKLDRLARNVAFISALLESKDVPFVAIDNPAASPMLIQMTAVFAEHEAREISNRTKKALQVAKAKGKKLGASRPGHFKASKRQRQEWQLKATAASSEVRSAKTKLAYDFLLPTLKEFYRDAQAEFDRQVEENGRGNTACPVYQTVASRLNKLGHTTTAGKPFTATAVWRILRRYAPNASYRVYSERA